MNLVQKKSILIILNGCCLVAVSYSKTIPLTRESSAAGGEVEAPTSDPNPSESEPNVLSTIEQSSKYASPAVRNVIPAVAVAAPHRKRPIGEEYAGNNNVGGQKQEEESRNRVKRATSRSRSGRRRGGSRRGRKQRRRERRAPRRGRKMSDNAKYWLGKMSRRMARDQSVLRDPNRRGGRRGSRRQRGRQGRRGKRTKKNRGNKPRVPTEYEANKENLNDYFQSDILIREEEAKSIYEQIFDGSDGTRRRRKRASIPSRKWQKTTIPYLIDSDDEGKIDAIHNGMVKIEQNTCIRFTQETNETLPAAPESYMKFVGIGGCYAWVGEGDGENTIGIGRYCHNPNVVVHEIMHSMGFYHEQARSDRDEYVQIMFENLNEGATHNFAKIDSSIHNPLGIPYDFDSVLHYNPYAFNINDQPTIVPVDPLYGVTMGQRDHVAFTDFQQMNLLYSICAGVSNVCRNGGYPNPNNCNQCLCPWGILRQLSYQPGSVVGTAGSTCDDSEFDEDPRYPGCGGERTATSNWQTIEASFSNEYWIPEPTNRRYCGWFIKAPAGYRVQLYISNFEYMYECGGFLQITGLESDFTRRGPKMCDQLLESKGPHTFTSFANRMLVYTNPGPGRLDWTSTLTATYRMVPIGTDPQPTTTTTTTTTTTPEPPTTPEQTTPYPTTAAPEPTTPESTTPEPTTPEQATTPDQTTQAPATTTIPDNGYTEWTEWTECTHTCGGCGLSQRHRYEGSITRKRRQVQRCGVFACPEGTDPPEPISSDDGQNFRVKEANIKNEIRKRRREMKARQNRRRGGRRRGGANRPAKTRKRTKRDTGVCCVGYNLYTYSVWQWCSAN